MSVLTPEQPRWIVLVTATLLLWSVACFAQTDSLELERAIESFGRAATFAGNARALLVERLADGDSTGVRGLLGFMDHRGAEPGVGWLTASERLTVLTALPAIDILRDPVALRSLLEAQRGSSELSAVLDDGLSQRLRSILRARLDAISSSLGTAHAPEEEVRFTALVVNHLLVRGLRGRLELNDSVDALAVSAVTWRGGLAAEFLRRPYREEPFGAAFHAGYAIGAFSGRAGDAFGRVHGPTMAVEFYLRRVTLHASLTIGIAELLHGFTARGEPWPAGDAPTIIGRLAGGYEVRSELLALTPLLSLDVLSLRAPEPASGAPATGLRFGGSAGAQFGYRIPFDVGVHIDLRLRFTWAWTGLAAYDPQLGGSLWMIDAGFALVRRGYVGEE